MRGPASLPSRRGSLCPSRAPRPPVNVPWPSQSAVRLRRALGSTPSRQAQGPASLPGDTRASTRALGGHSTSVGHAPPREVSHVTATGSSERGHPSSQHRACPQRTGRAGQREQGVKADPFSATECSGCRAERRAVPALKKLPLHGHDVQREQGEAQGRRNHGGGPGGGMRSERGSSGRRVRWGSRAPRPRPSADLGTCPHFLQPHS